MEITRITKKNEDYFLPFLHESAGEERPGLIRLGAAGEDGTVLGALSALISPGYTEILSIYVPGACRRQGVGRALMEALLSLTEKGGGVSLYFPEDEEAALFLEAMGFELFQGIRIYSVTRGEIIRSEKLRRLLLKGSLKGIEEVSDLERGKEKALENYLSMKQFPTRGFYDPAWSTVSFSGNEVTSLLLAEAFPGGVNLEWFHIETGDPSEGRKHFANLIRKMELQTDFTGAERILFTSDSPKVLETLAELTGGAVHITERGGFQRGLFYDRPNK